MTIADLAEYAVDVNKDFKINEKMIGHGNFGDVYEGWRKKDNLHVAVKKLQDTSLDVDEQIGLIRELQILSNLKHPNCLSLVGFYVGKEISIITPFMPNGSLEEALNKFHKGNFDDFTPTRRMCSLYQICSVMAYLHSLDIIHRDFKPENIFLNENFDIVIADFGLSRIVQENVKLTKGNLGSPFYMAPEIYSSPTYTNAVDVFSFGVTIFNYFVPNILARIRLDDGKGRIRGKNDYLKRIRNGSRLMKEDELPDKYFKVYKACVDGNPQARPTFDELAETFENDEDLLIEGVDKDEYHRCIEKCKEERERLKNPATPAPKEAPPRQRRARIYY